MAQRASCKGCQERYMGCHVECQKYIAWKCMHDKERKVLKEFKKGLYEDLHREGKLYSRH